MQLRVVSYNVRVGIESSLDTIIAELRTAPAADLIAFQEIGVRWNMGEAVDQPRYLAAGLGLDHVVFGGALTDERGGQFGIALASRYPIISHSVTEHHREDDEQRVLLEALIDAPTPFHVLTSHLSVSASERLVQARSIAARSKSLSGPVLVLGDFNDRPGSDVYDTLTAEFTDCFFVCGDGPPETFSVEEPHRQIDYVMTREPLYPDGRSWVERTVTASDHFPLFAEIRMR